MQIDQISRLAALAVAIAATGSAQAAIAVIDGVSGQFPGGTYTEVAPAPDAGGAGVYGVENRGGAGNTWEIGVGTGTSQAGAFVQADKD